MITKITGKLESVAGDIVALAVGSFEYEVMVPEFVRRRLQSQLGESITLYTVHYLEGNPAQGRLSPRLVGFLNPIEREFFALFCSVDGVGVKKALRAMVRPVREVAALIEEQSVDSLSELPGIGPATAERIIAKLRRKVPRFALLVEQQETYAADVPSDVVRETYDVLRTLGHNESDARRRVEEALATKQKFRDVDELIRVIYQQQSQRRESNP